MAATATTKSLCTITLLTSAALTLTGCVPSAGGFSVLDEPADASDRLPAGLPSDATENLDAGSARFVGEDQGNQLYLLRNQEKSVCLLVYGPPEEWFAGCGGDHFRTGSSSVAYEVWADGRAPSEQPNQVSPNVYVVEPVQP